MASLTDKIYDTLKERLIEAEPGTFLSVRKCAAELEMSYTPVREALLRLHSEGLLDLIPNVGFFVVSLDIDSIISIYQSRECVEQYVLPQIVKTLTETDIAYLRGVLITQEEALQNRKLAKYARCDIDFHVHLVDKLSNHYLSNFYKSVREQYLFCSRNIAQEQSGLAIREHNEFLDLVENKEYEKAVQSMTMHTRNALERIKTGYIRVTNTDDML